MLVKRLPKDDPDLSSLEIKKHKEEVIAVMFVAVGVAMELIVVPHSLLEVARLTASNLELRKQAAPRRLIGKQKDFITSSLNVTNLTFPPGLPPNWTPNILIVTPAFDDESWDFADDFASALRKAGWFVRETHPLLNARFGVHLKTMPETPSNLPGLRELRTVLKSLEIQYDEASITDADKTVILEKAIASGGIYLFIEHKPSLKD